MQTATGQAELKQLYEAERGVSNIGLPRQYQSLESTAKKYGIDFALKKGAGKPAPAIWFSSSGRTI